ncbi:MAG: carboxylating nicotinate-nucleotide diphosphorylase [Proteobacteria bacterium]|nr:carboxylating nicotinate-nucleotide diphosphorylase [Pseudomonadota bacterium]
MINPVILKKVVNDALQEDIGFLDITNEIIDRDLTGRAYFLAKEDFVISGIEVAKEVFKQLDGELVVSFNKKDGDTVRRGDRFGFVEGRLCSILTAERTALNFLQRLSGISTLCSLLSKKAGKFGIKILDTRKTTPLLRSFEKYAVKVGGAYNHRFSLTDGILIKDNHIAVIGSVKKAISLAKEKKTALLKVAVEVKNLKELGEAIKAGADHIMLDNMSPEDIRKALSMKKNGITYEVSGGINSENFDNYLIKGIDYISLGFLTHSVKAVDISLEIEG